MNKELLGETLQRIPFETIVILNFSLKLCIVILSTLYSSFNFEERL